MKAVYHPAVQADVSRILRHYDSINGQLGDEFWAELNSFIQHAVAHPQQFHFQAGDRRRVNLRRFPYHFLFREVPGGIRITVIRHHKQHPEHGLKRRQPRGLSVLHLESKPAWERRNMRFGQAQRRRRAALGATPPPLAVISPPAVACAKAG